MMKMLTDTARKAIHPSWNHLHVGKNSATPGSKSGDGVFKRQKSAARSELATVYARGDCHLAALEKVDRTIHNCGGRGFYPWAKGMVLAKGW